MLFYFSVILAFAIDVLSAFSLIRDPCIVDTATHDRFNESNLIFTIGEEFFEVHLRTGLLQKSGLIKDHWPEVLSVEGPLNIGTSIPGRIHFSKYISNGTILWVYDCFGTVYNCKLNRTTYSAPSIIHVVAGFIYQPHMPIEPRPPPEVVKNHHYVVLPSSGQEFLQCEVTRRRKTEQYQRECTKYGYKELNYTNFRLCRGNPDINKLTAISVAYNETSKIVDFVVFFKGVMRYTVDGHLKQISLHRFAACPLSFKKVFLTQVILVLTVVTIGILIYSGVYYKKYRSVSSEDEATVVARR